MLANYDKATTVGVIIRNARNVLIVQEIINLLIVSIKIVYVVSGTCVGGDSLIVTLNPRRGGEERGWIIPLHSLSTLDTLQLRVTRVGAMSEPHNTHLSSHIKSQDINQGFT